MARSLGIHIDQRSFHVVALDGSAKKHRLVAGASGSVPLDQDPVGAVTDALKKVVREHNLKPESVAIAVDSGIAAFRMLTVPFDDRGKIEDIIKFEIESDLPQWDIDDVIVDFLVLGTKPGVESNLLVTAVPKVRLERQLAACERAGLEAQHAELDGSALFEAAHASGRLTSGSAQVLVHVGDASTTVVVVDDGRLVSMRTIRAGALPRQEQQSPAEGDGEDLNGEPLEGEAAVAERLARTAARIRRELTRTVTGVVTAHEIEAVYVCGHTLEGLAEPGGPAEIAGVPVRPLNPGPDGGDEPGEEDELQAIAYGAALRALGAGVLEPELRRDELRFTGKFERLELPLAVFSLLLCTLLGVKLIVTEKQILWRDEGNVDVSEGDMQVWLKSANDYLFANPETGYPGRLTDPPKSIADYAERAERGLDETRTKYQEIAFLRSMLDKELKELKRDLGQMSDFAQPQSALQGMTLVLETIGSMKDRVGRFSIRSLDAKFIGGSSSRSQDRVEVRLDMDFFAESGGQANQHHAELMREIRAKDWCLEYEEVSSKPFPGGGGLSFDRIRIDVDVAKYLAEQKLQEQT